jgi:acetylglutamate kinase
LKLTVKLGGSILEEATIRQGILTQVAGLRRQGHEVILVHGGGKSLNRRLSQLGLPSRFREGLRVTDKETLAVAVMVLAGEVNKKLVSEMGNIGLKALGLCGADVEAVRCVGLSERPESEGELGFVGRPAGINREFFDLILGAHIIPVVASIALGSDAQLYNINADEMASVCARGTQCEALIYLTDVEGVKGSDGAVLSELGSSEVKDLRETGVLSGGMLPKTRSCLDALEGGVRSVFILPGSSPNILDKFISGNLTEGTCIHGND